jgi:hypothetical protein
VITLLNEMKLTRKWRCVDRKAVVSVLHHPVVSCRVQGCIRVIFKRISELEAAVVVLKRRLVVANSRHSGPSDAAGVGSQSVVDGDDYQEEFDVDDDDGYGSDTFDDDT